jgi:hypothetical protein
MLFRETVAVYCENHTKHTNTLCKQNAEFQYVEAGGTYSNHRTLKALLHYIFPAIWKCRMALQLN